MKIRRPRTSLTSDVRNQSQRPEVRVSRTGESLTGAPQTGPAASLPTTQSPTRNLPLVPSVRQFFTFVSRTSSGQTEDAGSPIILVHGAGAFLGGGESIAPKWLSRVTVGRFMDLERHDPRAAFPPNHAVRGNTPKALELPCRR